MVALIERGVGWTLSPTHPNDRISKALQFA
jgi:hypothetical protein